ncbi:MAG: Ca-activated chloride channel family protein [Patiriisocius sp.]|jgi:Ca-activated chloride channel family protein
MTHLKYLLIIFVLLFSTKEIAAQKDTIAQQRTARKMLREGNELYKKEQFTDASVSYQKALGSNSNYDKATYNLGNALYKNKNYKEAIPQYELTAKTATDKNTKAEAFHNIGNANMESKNYQGAVDAFKNALRNNPTDDETRYNLAVAQKLLDKENKDDKNKDKDKKDKKDQKDKDKDKKDQKDQKDKDKKDDDKDGDGDKDKDKKQDPKKDKKKEPQKPKPKKGKMTPQQVKQLLESLNNEEKKTQKKMNAKKAKGKKVKQEKDW